MLVGATLVILLIQIAAESVPLIGGLVGLVVTGPLYGGLYWLNLRLVRGEPAEFSDAFAGFNRAFVQLMLVNIIISLIIMAILVPGAVGVLGGLALMGVFGELADIVPNLSLPPLLTPLGYVFFAIGCLMAVAGVLATIYLTVCWWFGIPLVVDRQMDFWAAMKLSRAQIRKHWWGMFGFGFICCLVFGLGILLCGIGILVTIPIVVAASMYAYEDLFGRSSATSS